MDFLYKEYGEKLKNIRKQQKYTQKEVNELIGIGTDTLWRLENGLVEPTIHNLNKLSKLYKIDLLELLIKYRRTSSLLSKDLIRRTNKYMSNSEFDKLATEIEAIKEDIKNDQIGFEYISNSTELLNNYLDALKHVTVYDMTDKDTLAQKLEQTLQAISKNNTILTDNFLYEFEITMGIFFSIVQRRNNNFEEASKILDALEKNLTENDYPQELKDNYIGTILYNRSVIYHRISEHEKVIETVNHAMNIMETFSHKRLTFLLLFRKAISMYFLEDENYVYILYTVLTHLKGNEKNLIEHAVFSIHDIKHPILESIKPDKYK